MFKTNRVIARVLMLALPLLATAFNSQASQLPGFTELIKETAPAVVNISTTQKVQSGLP